MNPLNLLNQFQKINLNTLFPNLATVASAERAFSLMVWIKFIFRSVMTQGSFVFKVDLAKQNDFNHVFDRFATKKNPEKHSFDLLSTKF